MDSRLSSPDPGPTDDCRDDRLPRRAKSDGQVPNVPLISGRGRPRSDATAVTMAG